MTQSEALSTLKTGSNVFVTGESGSGKTHRINEYVAYLRARGIEPAIAASTGIAATHIGGMTGEEMTARYERFLRRCGGTVQSENRVSAPNVARTLGGTMTRETPPSSSCHTLFALSSF
ncbi:MAG: AAA family ATPase [Nitrospira sp.]